MVAKYLGYLSIVSCFQTGERTSSVFHRMNVPRGFMLAIVDVFFTALPCPYVRPKT